MEALLFMLAFFIGAAMGFAAAKLSEKAREEKAITVVPDSADPRTLKQYQNFLSYDGTGKGQLNIED